MTRDFRDPIARLNAAAFDNFHGNNYDPQSDLESSYDEEENYDPMAAVNNFAPIPGANPMTVIGNRKPARKPTRATFNVSIVGANADGLGNVAPHVFELFNSMFSISKFENQETNPGLKTLGAAYLNVLKNGAGDNIDYVAYGEIASPSAGSAALEKNDLVYWRPDGSLVYNYNVLTGDSVIISCKELPYRAMLDYLMSGSFKISKMRIQYAIQAQIQQDFQLTQKNILGTKNSSSIAPKQFFSPNQFQSLLVDCNTPFTINKEKGLFATLLPASTMSITFFVDDYVVMGV